MELPLPPRATRTPTHHHHHHAAAYTPLSHLNHKTAMFATSARTASPLTSYNRTNMSLLPRTGSSSSLHSLTRSPAFMKARPSPSPSSFPSPMLGSSLSSLTTSALIASHLSSSASSLSLSSLSSLTHSPMQSGSSSGTIINILSKLNSSEVDDVSLDEIDAHAYTEVASHSSSSSSSNNSTNGEIDEEDVSPMYDYGSHHTSGHMDTMDSSVLSVSTSSSIMSNMASSSLSYMSFGGNSHYAHPHRDMNEEYPEAAKDVPTHPHTQASTHQSTATEADFDLETGNAASASASTLSKVPSYANLKNGLSHYNTRSRRASSDQLASPYLSPLLLAVMNNETLSSLPSLSFASPALSPSIGAFSGNHRTTMAMPQSHHTGHAQAQHGHGHHHVPLSPMSSSNTTGGMTSMPALSPMSSPQASPSMSPLMGSRTLGNMHLSLSSSSLSTLHAGPMWPTSSPASSPSLASTSAATGSSMMSHYPPQHSYGMASFHHQQQQQYYQQQQQLAQHQHHQHQHQQHQHHHHNHAHAHPHPTYGSYQPSYYGHEQVMVKLEPRVPCAHEDDMSAHHTHTHTHQPSALAAAVASASARAGSTPSSAVTSPTAVTGQKRKSLDAELDGEASASASTGPRRVKKTIPKKSVKRRKKTGNESPSSDEADDELQATLSGDYKYQCTYQDCGDCFKTRFSLKRHLKKHTGEKPYVCGIDGCDKTFAEKSTLKRHLRIHTGEKPYQCHVPGCGKLFADRTNVKRHEMIHSGERPYWCPFASCTRGYFWRKHLRKHVSSVHHANLSALSSYAKKNKQGEIIPGTGIVATAQTVPQSRESGGRVDEEDDIIDDPDDVAGDEDEEDMMEQQQPSAEPSPRPKSKRITTKKSRK